MRQAGGGPRDTAPLCASLTHDCCRRHAHTWSQVPSSSTSVVSTPLHRPGAPLAKLSCTCLRHAGCASTRLLLQGSTA